MSTNSRVRSRSEATVIRVTCRAHMLNVVLQYTESVATPERKWYNRAWSYSFPCNKVAQGAQAVSYKQPWEFVSQMDGWTSCARHHIPESLMLRTVPDPPPASVNDVMSSLNLIGLLSVQRSQTMSPPSTQGNANQSALCTKRQPERWREIKVYRKAARWPLRDVDQ